jgi:tetratricopeptide (TPR) repeat protein
LVETVAGGEIAARHIDVVTRYIVGTAAALSRDFLLAEELLLGAHERVNALRGLGPDKLLERVIAARLVELYDARLHFLGQWFTLKRDVKALVESESTVAKLRRYAPGHYGAKLAAATCAFCLRKDLPAARAEIDSCKGEDDAAWLYSKAFLHLYEGDLDQAYKAYRDAFGRRHTAPDLPVQVEHFIQQVLEGEPEKVLLLYGLGLINRKAKGDLVAARNDFAQLLQYLDPQSQEKHVRIVGQWVRELDAELSDEDRCRGQGSN